MAIQKPYGISISGATFTSSEDELIKWKVSGATSVKYSVYFYYNNFFDVKITAHGLANGDVVVNTTRDSTYTGIRSVTTIDTDNFSLSSEITNQAVGDSMDLFNEDTTIDSTASSTSTDTVIELTNTGTIVAGDVVLVDGEYRLVSSVTTDTSITVSTAFSTSTASKTVQAFHKYNSTTIEYAFKKESVSSYATEYNLLANSILNGKDFKFKVTVFDENNNSATSDPVTFETSSRPSVTLDAIGTVESQSYNFTANYSQSESVAMKSYIFYLYDSDKIEINNSDIKTDTPIEHLFDGLQSDSIYYVEFKATSDKDITGTTGLVQFDVVYAQPNMSTNLTAENYDDASIRLNWSVKQILGEKYNSTYDANNEKLDTTNGKAWFNSGFTINDLTLKLWLESVTDITVTSETKLIAYNSDPSNKNSLWIDDGNVDIETELTIVSSDVEPTTDKVWIVDPESSTEKSYSITVDPNEPTDQKAIWVDSVNIKDTLKLVKLNGDNGYLSLEYYNSAFHLYKYEDGVRELMASYSASGSSYYVYLQQDGDTYNLYAEVVA